MHGVRREGYQVFWDGEHGGMSAQGLAHAERSVCIVFWTRDALYSKWAIEGAWNAARRGALVEVTIDPIQSPIEGVDEKPLDFSDWDGRAVGPQWKALMSRVRAAAGRPTGKLPLKEEAQPALWMVGLTFVAVATLAAGGLPDSRLQSDSMASLGAESLPTSSVIAVGGPQAGVHEPASAASADGPPAITARFDLLEPAPSVQIVPLHDFDSAALIGSDPAPAQTADARTADAGGNPAL